MTESADYERLRGSVGLVDRSERGKLLVEGAEAAEFLQGQLTNDVVALSPGTGCYAALLSHKGKMRADARVLRGDGWIWLDSERIGLPALLRTMTTYSLGRDVLFEDRTATHSILSLIGPGARDALRAEQVPPEREHAFVEADDRLFVATDLGVDVLCPLGKAAAVREALAVEAVSESAAECLRIESGRPRYGLEMDIETIPQEAGLNERAVSYTKGCYVGQETVARLYYKGKPNRHLRGLVLSAPAERAAALVLRERVVGRIGSSAVSPVHGPIALALVRREASPGDTVLVGDAGAPAEIVDLPFPPGQRG